MIAVSSRRRLLVPLLAASAFLAACPSGTSNPDGGVVPEELPAPELTGVAPTSGPLAGGTEVLLSGENFVEGATVRFGGIDATDVTVSTARRISARTPPRPMAGAVSVEVKNPDGKTAALPSGFVYEADQGPSISEARLLGDAVVRDQSGQDPVTFPVFAGVWVPELTAAEGAGEGIRAQVGWAEDAGGLSLAALTWTDAAYDHDLEQGDVYTAQLQVPGAMGSELKVYAVAARFSLDDGQTWLIADLDGAANGTELAQLQRLEVSRNRVDWCRMGGQQAEAPPNLSLSAGGAGPLTFVQVWEPGVTTSGGPGQGLETELGYGAFESDPRTAEWTWTAGQYNADTGAGGSDDEWMATLANPGEGSYSFTWRVRLDGGPWRYCDADGSGAETGFELEQMGRLTVTPAAAVVDRCALQHPSTLTTAEGATSAPVYGRVWAQGITDGAGQGGGITGEVGYGPTNVDPSEPSWTWTGAAFNVDEGTGDEYQGTFTGPAPGNYHYAFRFRVGSGTWTYCDLDGSDTGGFSNAQAGVLTALPPQPACRLEQVVQPGVTQPVTTVASGDPLQARARVLLPGVTHLPGQAANVMAQIGVGTAGTDASNTPAWGWQNATFASDDAATGEDVWEAAFHPAYTGTRAVSFRFSTDSGTSWTYCDLDGSANGYDPAQQHAMTVVKHQDIEYCNLQWPPTAVNGDTVYGQVYEAGITPSASATASHAAFDVELGWGHELEDPGLTWNWSAAVFNVNSVNNDEYSASLLGLPTGTWSYAMRFRKKPSGGWCYGDLNGHGDAIAVDGFSGQNMAGDPNLGQATIP